MPFKSKAQFHKFFAMANRGEIPMTKAKEWAKETPDIKSLPEKVNPREKYVQMLKNK